VRYRQTAEEQAYQPVQAVDFRGQCLMAAGHRTELLVLWIVVGVGLARIGSNQRLETGRLEEAGGRLTFVQRDVVFVRAQIAQSNCWQLLGDVVVVVELVQRMSARCTETVPGIAGEARLSPP
jgi:hypothetical protein